MVGVKLVLFYTLIAGVISALTAPIPGTSLLLTALEIYMIVHLAKVNDYQIGVEGDRIFRCGDLGTFHNLEGYCAGNPQFLPHHWLDGGSDRGGIIRFLFGEPGESCISRRKHNLINSGEGGTLSR